MGLRRNGLRTVVFLTKKICRLITRYQNDIRNAYPESTALHLALESALLACSALAVAGDEALPEGV